MKRIFTCMLALFMLSLSACTVPSNGSVETSSQAITTAPTTAPEETTAVLGLSADDCLIPELDTLSYEEFFAEDRPFAGSNRCDWLIPKGDAMIRYRAVLDDTVLTVQSDAEEAVYTVPRSLEPGFQLLAADGKYAYLLGYSSVQQIDLFTGIIEPITYGDAILSADICGRDVLYYARKNEGSISIRRVYLPTGQNDLLYSGLSGDVPFGSLGFSLGAPKSTLGAFSWSTVNPEMMALVRTEISNPESQYRTEEIPPLWDSEDPLALGTSLVHLIMPLQEDTGVRGLIQYTYNQADGTCTEKLGIVDNCWVGSGVNHDHYAQDLEQEAAAPVLADLEWQPIADLSPTDPEDYAGEWDSRYVDLYSEQFRPYQLYWGSDDIYRKLTDAFYTAVKEDKQYLYGITAENVLVQISYEDGSCTPLYTGQNGDISLLNCQNGTLYFKDGEYVVQLDVPGARYRKILTGAPIGYLEIVSTGLYVEVVYGGAYLFDPDAQTLTPATPHL